MSHWIERGVGAVLLLFLLAFAIIQTVIAVEERSKVAGLQQEITEQEKILGTVADSREKCRTALIESNAQLRIVDRWFLIAGGRDK
jgi:hypothetical protein